MRTTHSSIKLLALALAWATAATVAAAATEPPSPPPSDTVTTTADAPLGAPGLAWWSVDGGGATSSGGVFTLVGTAGQPEAGPSEAPGAALDGGLWSDLVECAGGVFCDGFESGDLDFWSSSTP